MKYGRGFALREAWQPRTDRLRTRLRVRWDACGAERIGWAQNLSETGIFVDTNEPAKVGALVLLRIELPERVLLQRAEVVWAIRVPEHQRASLICGMGLRFVDTDPDWPALFRRFRASGDDRP